MVNYFIIFGKSLNRIELFLLSGIAWGYWPDTLWIHYMDCWIIT